MNTKLEVIDGEPLPEMQSRPQNPLIHLPATTAPAQVETQPLTPMGLIQMAVSKGADITQLERLMALQERWEENEARKAFNAAFAAFKANPPEIIKNKLVSFELKDGKGTTSYRHATLDEVALRISEALAPHGLSFRWDTNQSNARIQVTCILQHVLGHAVAVTLDGPPDSTGLKSAVQQTCSTVTMLQRYTLLAVTGCAAKDQDTDGADRLTEGDGSDLTFKINQAQSLDELTRANAEAWKAAKTKVEMAMILRAKEARKAFLTSKEQK